MLHLVGSYQYRVTMHQTMNIKCTVHVSALSQAIISLVTEKETKYVAYM